MSWLMGSLTVLNLYSVLACRLWYAQGEVDILLDQSTESVKIKVKDRGKRIHM